LPQNTATKGLLKWQKFLICLDGKIFFYFRLIIPTEQHSALDFKQIALSLRTQDKEKAIPRALKPASHFKAFLQDLKTGKAAKLSRSELKSQASAIPDPRQISLARLNRLQ